MAKFFRISAHRTGEKTGAQGIGGAGKAATAALLGGALLTLAACNTVQGVGRDIESVGKKGDEVLTGDEG